MESFSYLLGHLIYIVVVGRLGRVLADVQALELLPGLLEDFGILCLAGRLARRIHGPRLHRLVRLYRRGFEGTILIDVLLEV